MPDKLMAYASAMTEAEERLGIAPLEGLLDERRHLLNKVATLRAKYGGYGSTFEHLRKVELARLNGLIRAQALRDKRKVTESQLDAEAHAHPDYVEFVTMATVQRAEWVKLEAQIEEIDFIIQRGQALARVARWEPVS